MIRLHLLGPFSVIPVLVNILLHISVNPLQALLYINNYAGCSYYATETASCYANCNWRLLCVTQLENLYHFY